MSLKKILKKIRDSVRSLWYRYCYGSRALDEHLILLDSKNGKDLGSNMLRIGEELMLNPEYEEYEIYFSCNQNKEESFRQMLSQCETGRFRLVREAGFRHYSLLARAKYIFTDTSFPLEYAKKDGQVIINTWHGTPLKKMGCHDPQLSYVMGNVQKSQLQADYLVYPSVYMKEIMFSAYCMERNYKGKVLYSGYPRNSVFFHKEKGESLRKKLGLQGKRIYAYMPTWRGSLVNIRASEQMERVRNDLHQIDEMLNEDELCLLRLHPFVASAFDCRGYSHIQTFPAEEDPYAVLNMADCLVTDYSSVFYDFANTGRKIILFIYDREQYMDERGIYMNIEELPFPVVGTVEELMLELRSTVKSEYDEFRKTYCTFDGPNSAQDLCSHIIKGGKILPEFRQEDNGKESILIYVGSLGDDEVTSILMQGVWEKSLGDANYTVAFWSPYLHDDPDRVDKIPDWADMIPMTGLADGGDSGWGGYERYFGQCRFDRIICCREENRDIRAIFENVSEGEVLFADTPEKAREIMR